MDKLKLWIADHKKESAAAAAAAVLLVIILAVALAKSRGEPAFTPGTIEPKDSFQAYVYTEKHSDGSRMEVAVEKHNDICVAVLTYYDQNKAGMRELYELDKAKSAEFMKLVADAENVAEPEESEGIYAGGQLVLDSDGSSSSMYVEPVDLSAFGITSPWERDSVKLAVVSKHEDNFAAKAVENLGGTEGSAQTAVLMDFIYSQAETLYGKELPEGCFLEIDTDLESDGMCPLIIYDAEKNEAARFAVSHYGYVAAVDNAINNASDQPDPDKDSDKDVKE